MAEILKVPTSSSIRDELESLVLTDLFGPAGGPEEELDEASVSDRYLVGMLASQKTPSKSDANEELALGGNETYDDGKTDTGAPQAESIIPSSFGMTFSMSGNTTGIKITARWGHYLRVDSETLINDKTDNPKKVWKRAPMEGISEPIALKEGSIQPWIVTEEQPDIIVKGLVRKNIGDWIVTLFLVNDQPEQKRLADEMWIFQPELSVEAADGSPVFIKRTRKHDQNLLDSLTYAEERSMAMLYRHKVEFAVGHGVAVQAEVDPNDSTRAIRISSRSAPIYEVPMQTPPTVTETPDLSGLILDMKVLAETKSDDLFDNLKSLPIAYENWIKNERTKFNKPDLSEFKEEAETALKNCDKSLKRINEGLELLKHNKQAEEAFQFANEAMWLQRTHTIYAEKVRRGEKVKFQAVDIELNRSWYPFQIAFILLNLPGITDFNHNDRTDPVNATADLLWFPTGGGKTEAYLGLAAYTIGLRRLQGEIAGRSGEYGIAVIMRYTLRLLTLQQFQRASTLLCACEDIRRSRSKKGDKSLGEEPFRIGIWVGQRNTPNTTDQSNEAIKQDHGHYFRSSAAAGSGSPAQLKHCPWCGNPINPGRDIKVETYRNGRGRTLTYCSDSLGKCLFSKRQSPDEGIPVMVVDEEIYRRLPTLLIATVDKFAQMPWKGATQMLFGQINGYCPRHGFKSPEIEDSNSHPKRGSFPPVKSEQRSLIRPPDLIIQDELHLIVGPLGTLVGLYETAVDELATWEVNGKRIRPKVIASTATIRRASDQVNQLFLRKVEIFPPQATDVRDNFFSKQREPDEQFPGRRYLGICAPGKRLKEANVRTFGAFLGAAQMLYEKYGLHADPWMTLVGYFNSIRELGGTRRLVDDRIRSLLRDIDQRGLARRGKPFVRELTSRLAATDIPDILDQLEVVFDPEVEKQRKLLYKAGKRTDKPLPIDVLLATNMISVGVDVKRLGLMVVTGQPKTTAEYIQATSRVGRNSPGLVCTIYNWARPRDLSHYERFEHYHATFHQHVEALSVTPFSARALDRGLTALFVSLIRLAGEEFNGNTTAAIIDRNHEYVERAIECIAERAVAVEGTKEVGENIKAMLKSRLDLWLAQAQRPTGGNFLGYKDEKDGVTKGLLKTAGLGPWETFTCLTSLRGVEPSVGLVLDDRGLDDSEYSAPQNSSPQEES